MSKLVKNAATEVAARSSRRGFLYRVSKMTVAVVGGAAVVDATTGAALADDTNLPPMAELADDQLDALLAAAGAC